MCKSPQLGKRPGVQGVREAGRKGRRGRQALGEESGLYIRSKRESWVILARGGLIRFASHKGG